MVPDISWGSFWEEPVFSAKAKGKFSDKLLGFIVKVKINGVVVKKVASNTKVHQYEGNVEY